MWSINKHTHTNTHANIAPFDFSLLLWVCALVLWMWICMRMYVPDGRERDGEQMGETRANGSVSKQANKNIYTDRWDHYHRYSHRFHWTPPPPIVVSNRYYLPYIQQHVIEQRITSPVLHIIFYISAHHKINWTAHNRYTVKFYHMWMCACAGDIRQLEAFIILANRWNPRNKLFFNVVCTLEGNLREINFYDNKLYSSACVLLNASMRLSNAMAKIYYWIVLCVFFFFFQFNWFMAMRL